MNNSSFHIPVLLEETLRALEIKQNNWYVDCTVGGGGHSEAILERGGKVCGLDQDEEALKVATQRLGPWIASGKCVLTNSNFRHIDEVVGKLNIKISGVVFDLGVSSYQLGGNQRGFSFRYDEPLDMRMDPKTQTVTAKDLVNGLYEKELEKLISIYGEDQLAHKIARIIVTLRKKKPIETTGELAEIIENIYRHAYRSKSDLHPATKVFQALRIAVNDEINILEEALEKALEVVNEGGRIAVITFHGLEDKTVKETFMRWVESNKGINKSEKPLIPSGGEITENPRSRSAKLRIFEKTAYV